MELKKHLSTIVATVLVFGVLFNANKILSYQDIDGIIADSEAEYTFNVDVMQEESRDYSSLSSIKTHSKSMGDLAMTDLSFSQPDMLAEEKLEEGDNKRIYFFGELEPNTDQPVEEWEDSVGSTNNGWTSWETGSKGGDTETTENWGTVTNPTTNTGNTNEGPIEVTFDRFIGEQKDKIEGDN